MIATDYFVAHIFIKYKSGQCEQIAFHLANKFRARHRPNSIVSSIKLPVRFHQTIYILYFRLFICEFIVNVWCVNVVFVVHQKMSCSSSLYSLQSVFVEHC